MLSGHLCKPMFHCKLGLIFVSISAYVVWPRPLLPNSEWSPEGAQVILLFCDIEANWLRVDVRPRLERHVKIIRDVYLTLLFAVVLHFFVQIWRIDLVKVQNFRS